MRKIAILIAFSLSVVSCEISGVKVNPLQDEATLNTVKEITTTSFKTIVPKMMGTVMGKVEKEGYASAVKFCNENVAGMGQSATKALEEKFQKEYGIKSFRFGRTSDKLRNPKNAPGPARQFVLNEWNNQESSENKAAPQFVESEGVYYGMMPIRISSAACLGCHGTPDKLDQEALELIKERYPQDSALGYKLNDLRGGFWVRIEM